MESPICNLCKKRSADKKNSHIIPHGLIKSMANQLGKKEREYEINFRIGYLEDETYIGRSVSPEKIEEVLGKDQISKNINPYVRDYILCRICEERIASIESSYLGAKTTLSENQTTKKIACKEAILFWLSIIWRCSIASFTGFKLDRKLEKRVETILNNLLPSAETETKHYEQLDAFSYRLFKLPPSDDSTKNSLSILKYNSSLPLRLILNEYILVFYYNNSTLPYSFFGLEKILEEAHINTFVDKVEKVINIDSKVEQEINFKLTNTITKQKIKSIETMVRTVFIETTGIQPSVNIVENLCYNIINSPVPTAQIYTIENYARVFAEFFGVKR